MAVFENEYVQIILSSAAVYLFVIIAIRLFGKKELSQLSVIDLVFVLLISNSVQNAMVGSNSTLLGGLIAAATLFLINFLFKKILVRFPKFGKLIQGESMMLVYNGVPNNKNMKDSMITMDELMEAIREHGVSKIEDVDLAILEVDGNISVLSHDFQNRSKRKRKSKYTQTSQNN
jgi:uncharacterized membrane protein YcaP (DUF421 family)